MANQINPVAIKKKSLKKPTERIEVRKIFVGSAARFGILYGVIWSIFLAILFTILYFFDVGARPDGGTYLLITFTNILWVDIIMFFVGFPIVFLLVCIFGSLFYNLIAKIGGMLHVGLAEYEPNLKKMNSKVRIQGKTQVKGSSRTGASTSTISANVRIPKK